jgi:hypothetical protein
MIPEFSSITTLAGVSGLTRICSILVIRSTTLSRYSKGTSKEIVEGSRDLAADIPKRALIASAVRREVVKSGFLRAILIVVISLRMKGTSFSIIAPFAILPEVGTPRETLAEPPVAAIALVEICPCAMA